MEAIKPKIEAGIGQAGYKIPDVKPEEIQTYEAAVYSLNLERLCKNFFSEYIKIRCQQQVDPIHKRYRLKVISTSLALGLSFAIYRFTLPYFTRKWEECVATAKEISQSHWTYDYVTSGEAIQGTVHYNGKTTGCGGWYTVSPEDPICIWSGNYYRTLSYLRWGAIGILPIDAMAKTPEVPSRNLYEISVNSAALENERTGTNYICPLSKKPLNNPNSCFFIGNTAFDALSCINLWINELTFVHPQAFHSNTNTILSSSELFMLDRQSKEIFGINLSLDFYAALSISSCELAESYSLEDHAFTRDDSQLFEAFMGADYQKVINDYMQQPEMNLKELYHQNRARYNSSTEQQKVEAYKDLYGPYNTL